MTEETETTKLREMTDYSAQLRAMEQGETLTFAAPSAGAIESAKTTAYRLQHQLGCKFSVKSDYASGTFQITRL